MQGTLYLTCHTLLKFEIETMNPTNYQKILDNVSGIIADHTERFSIFDMLGQSSRELTHSAFIAQMLNPRGKHGLGITFLNLFLEQLSLRKEFDTVNVEVEIEKDLGPKEGFGADAKGGRIDIYIKNSKGQIIVIENKIYATDQTNQLQRYRNSTGPDSIIFYLSLDGHAPSNSPQSIDYRLISYGDEIKHWLIKCLETVKENRHLSTIIQQYMFTIDNLTSDQEVTNIIQSSSSNIRAALQIARLADKARNNLKHQFLKELSQHLSLDVTNIHEDGKEIILNDCHVDWVIEHNLFIRFKEKNERVRQFINIWWQENEHDSLPERNWIYIKLHGDKINLHDFSTNACAWLDNNTKKAFWAKLDVVIRKIVDLFENKS